MAKGSDYDKQWEYNMIFEILICKVNYSIRREDLLFSILIF